MCPFGIDLAEVREGCAFEASLVSRWASTTIDGFLETGNLMKITPATAVNILTYFADEIAKGVEPVFYIYQKRC